MKTALHFAHANGIPSATYRPLFDALSTDFDIAAIGQMGHNSRFPVTDQWPHLLQEVIESIESQFDSPVVGVGHSMGGVLTLMAAQQRPELFKAVIMLDSPVFHPVESLLIRAVKSVGLIDQITPAKRSRNRRTEWPDAESAMKYLKQRALFSRFDERCLHHYVHDGLKKRSDGRVELGFQLEVELGIFRTVPHRTIAKPGSVSVPVGVLVGQQTDTVLKHQYLRMKRTLGYRCKRIPGTHMFPLEHPGQTALELTNLAKELNCL